MNKIAALLAICCLSTFAWAADPSPPGYYSKFSYAYITENFLLPDCDTLPGSNKMVTGGLCWDYADNEIQYWNGSATQSVFVSAEGYTTSSDCTSETVEAGTTLICTDTDDALTYRCTATGTCVEAVPSEAATLSETASLSIRYHDRDTDGDGTPDERIVGDWDGDGTLEIADIESALIDLCDQDSDGTTDNSADIDGDGTAELYCGRTLRILPGAYGTGASYDSINLSANITGYTIRGSGVNQTILKAEYSRATLCGGSGPGTPQGIINAAGDNVHISDMTIYGIGERSSAIADCDEDGTASGGNDLAAQHGIQIGVSVADASEHVNVERVRIVNSDRMGIHFNWVTDGTVKDVEIEGAGEHGFGAACPKGLQIVDSAFRDAANNDRSRGVEIYCSGTGGSARNILIANNRFEQNARHIWAFTGPDNSTISRLTILGNSLESTDYDDASGNNAGRAIEIGGAASSTGAISQVLIARNQIAGSQAACISIAGVTNPLDSIQITGNQLSDCESVRKSYVSGSGDGGSIRVQDTAGVTGLVVDGNDIEVDRGLAGIVVYGTQSVVKNNTLRGTLDASSDGRDSMIYVASTATDTQIVANDIDLDGTSTGTVYGIYNGSADETRIAGNFIKMDAQNNVVGILINVGSDNIIIDNNRMEGGDNGIATANGASTGVVIAGNYAAPTNTSDAFSWAYNLGHGTDPVMVDNKCVGVTTSPCYRYNVSGFYRNNQTISGTPKTGGSFGALMYTGTCGATPCVVVDLDEDGVIESTDVCFVDAGQDADCDGTAD